MKKTKVLIYGPGACDEIITTIGLKPDGVEVTINQEFKFNSLDEYDYIFLDFKTFQHRGEFYKTEQDLFLKRSIDFLKKGKTLVFLFFEKINVQGSIGASFLKQYTYAEDFPFVRHQSNLKRGEFKTYFDLWGSTKGFFSVNDVEERESMDVISEIDRSPISFSTEFFSGAVMFFPMQKNPSDINKMFKVLIDSVITYSTKIKSQLPDWARIPIFEEEKILFEKITELEKEIVETDRKYQNFQHLKALSFKSEYALHNEVPDFIQNHLEVNVFRHEKYQEDFWILNEKKEKSAICEIKSAVKGFKKSMIYNLINHRDEHELPETYPGLLVVNVNLNAASWQDKLVPISPQDIRLASSENILISRVEDLLQLWYLKIKGKITKEEIFCLLTQNSGWLKVVSGSMPLIVKE
jgi:hypothetical protein